MPLVPVVAEAEAVVLGPTGRSVTEAVTPVPFGPTLLVTLKVPLGEELIVYVTEPVVPPGPDEAVADAVPEPTGRSVIEAVTPVPFGPELVVTVTVPFSEVLNVYVVVPCVPFGPVPAVTLRVPRSDIVNEYVTLPCVPELLLETVADVVPLAVGRSVTDADTPVLFGPELLVTLNVPLDELIVYVTLP